MFKVSSCVKDRESPYSLYIWLFTGGLKFVFVAKHVYVSIRVHDHEQVKETLGTV